MFRLKAVKVLVSCILALSLSLNVFTVFAESIREDSEVSTAPADEMLETWIDTYVYYINRVDGIPESPQDALNLTEGGPTNGPILFDGIDMKMPEIGEPCGATTYRWSDKWMERQAWEVARGLPRETDYWISAIQFEGILDVYEYMEDSNPKKAEVRQLINDLYEGYWLSGNHPTWDVNFPDQNYYNDDQAWWSMALSRGYRLTGDIRMLKSSDYLITKTFMEWDDTDWAEQGYPDAFGGAPWGGIPWRRVGNDVAVGLGSWAHSSANKNFCTEGNACYAALTLASTYKELVATTQDPELKAKYQAAYEEQFANGFKSYEWNKFHYIDLSTGRVTNGSYRLTGTVNHARDGVSCPVRADPYNHGTAAGSSYEMYVLTGDEKYRDEAKVLMDYALDQWTLSDGLTADCQGTGDDAAWKNIMWYIAAEMCYNGGFTEYKPYFEHNASLAWNNKNDVGLCNNAIQIKSNSRQASICSLLGVNFLYWSGSAGEEFYWNFSDLKAGGAVGNTAAGDKLNIAGAVEPVSQTPFTAVHSAGVPGTNNERATNLLIDNQSSKYCQNVRSDTAWFIMDAGEPVKTPGYAIRGANDDMNSPSRVLHTWTVEGSNDLAGPWTVISSPGAQGSGWTSNYKLRSFDFDSDAIPEEGFRYYRLNVTRGGTSAAGGAIGTSNYMIQFSYFGLVNSFMESGALAAQVEYGAVAQGDAVTITTTNGSNVVNVNGSVAKLPSSPVDAKTYISVKNRFIQVFPDTKLGYMFNPKDNVSAHMAIDVRFSDGTRLKDLAAVDQYGIGMHPADQGKGKKLVPGQWNYIETDLGKVADGKFITEILLGFEIEGAAPSTDISGVFDNIVVYRGAPDKYEDFKVYAAIYASSGALVDFAVADVPAVHAFLTVELDAPIVLDTGAAGSGGFGRYFYWTVDGFVPLCEPIPFNY